MVTFKVIEVIDSTTIKVSPNWECKTKSGIFGGNRVKVRDLSGLTGESIVFTRLNQLLINSKIGIELIAPELVDGSIQNDAVLSCNVYVGQTSILYYFPEFVHKD